MDRGPGGRGAGRLGPYGRALETAVCGTGVGVRLGAQAAGAAAAASHLRRSVRGSLGRRSLLPGPARAKALDPASAGGESGGTGLGRAGVGDDGAADVKKTNCSLT